MKRHLAIPSLAILFLISGTACRKEGPVEVLPAPPVFGADGPARTGKTPEEMIARNFERVNFEFDSAVLTPAGRQALDDNARILAEYPEIRIQVQGHCDERGTTEYNLALGDRRATSIKKYLAAAGVAPSRLETVSYGEERPLAAGHGEHAWAENRRAEFLVTGGDTARVSGTVR